VSPPRDVRTRFSDRAEDYAKYRPGYPEAMFDDLALVAGTVVADVGAGTGLSSEPFMNRGCVVWAVEPNDAMRQEAHRRLGGRPGYRAVAGSAEATGLSDASVDLVAAGQAFHWFDRSAARAEFVRILRPRGRAVVFWNVREVDGSPFLRDYEELLQAHATDYREVDHRNIGADALAGFFGGSYVTRRYPNEQTFDFEGLAGRLRSSSYTPPPGHPGHRAMMERLTRLFRDHAEDGSVCLRYATEAHLGELRA